MNQASKSVLVFSAHAADFVWRAGGAIALYTSRGWRVRILCLSFGERGESQGAWKQPGMMLDRVKKIRRTEAKQAATLLGAELNVGSIPALLVFLLSFSFLYCVVSLAFWGQTPGMAWCGLVARTEETEPLSFGQTALRWLGHWLTWALLGLPGLLAFSGRSLADRLSGSSTYETPFSGSSPA